VIATGWVLYGRGTEGHGGLYDMSNLLYYQLYR